MYNDNFHLIKRHMAAVIIGLVIFPMLKKYNITGTKKYSYLVENNKFKKLKVLKSHSLYRSKVAGNFFGWLSLN